MLKLSSCSRDQFIEAMTDDPADKFARTFRAKADMQNLWPQCVGVFLEDELLGAIIVTVSKRRPHVGNLQLLHTFAAHRRKGIGRQLVEASYAACQNQLDYFRVSAEPDAVKFYESLGFKFWGKQKSGCSISMFKVCGLDIGAGLYDKEDPVIKAALFSGKRGSLAESWGNENYANLLLATLL